MQLLLQIDMIRQVVDQDPNRRRNRAEGTDQVSQPQPASQAMAWRNWAKRTSTGV